MNGDARMLIEFDQVHRIKYMHTKENTRNIVVVITLGNLGVRQFSIENGRFYTNYETMDTFALREFGTKVFPKSYIRQRRI